MDMRNYRSFFRHAGLALAGVVMFLATCKAQKPVASGRIDNFCEWTLTGKVGNYTLTISGKGTIDTGGLGNDSPWGAWFRGIRTVVVREGVLGISGGTFRNCTGLTSVTIPASVSRIGMDVFWNCGQLTAIHVAASSEHFSSKDGVLFNKKKTVLLYFPVGKTGDYVIPGSVYIVDRGAFKECHGLTSVRVPRSVELIDAFSDCSRLTSIHVDAANKKYCSVDGVLFDKERTTLVRFPAGKTGDYVIPGTVTAIDRGAFRGCSSLTSVMIPGSVTEIGHSAFSRCVGLTSVTIPGSVTVIDQGTFSACGGLTSVIIPGSVVEVGSYAFTLCRNLTTVTIPASVVSFGWDIFKECDALTTVVNLSPVPRKIGVIFEPDVIFGGTLKVPAGAVEAYKAAPVWGKFGKIVAFD
jgi:hypothetical protein